MATGSGRRRSAARSSVGKTPADADAFPHIEQLIDDGGKITFGELHPINCGGRKRQAQHLGDPLTSVWRQLSWPPGETFAQLIARLDLAVGLAYVEDVFTDEINAPAPTSRRR